MDFMIQIPPESGYENEYTLHIPRLPELRENLDQATVFI
jgi:hypothetical protein